jgi:hypothetical protein
LRRPYNDPEELTGVLRCSIVNARRIGRFLSGAAGTIFSDIRIECPHYQKERYAQKD